MGTHRHRHHVRRFFAEFRQRFEDGFSLPPRCVPIVPATRAAVPCRAEIGAAGRDISLGIDDLDQAVESYRAASVP